MRTSIPVNHIRTMIQTQGYWAGTRAEIIELGSEEAGAPVNIDGLAERLTCDRVVIKGHDPFYYSNLNSLILALMARRRLISVETPGFIWQEIPFGVWLTLVVRASDSDRVCRDFWNRANEVRLTISNGDELDQNLPLMLECKPAYLAMPDIYLQPDPDDYERTLPIAIAMLERYPGCRVMLPVQNLNNFWDSI